MKHRFQTGQDEVDVQVISEDGTSLEEDLFPDEIVAFENIDLTLKANLQFQAAFPNGKLFRIDSNRGIKQDEAGRYYLRYQHDKGITEFWGHHTEKPYVDCAQGLVGIGILK